MLVVSEFGVEGETQNFGVRGHFKGGVANLQIEFLVILCRIRCE